MSSSRRALSPAKVLSPAPRGTLDSSGNSSFFFDFKQPLEVYCLAKSKMHFERVAILTVDDLRAARLEDDLLYLQDPDKYIFCVRPTSLGQLEKQGILKATSKRLMSPESPLIKTSKLSPFNCRFKDIQKKATASSKMLGDFVLSNNIQRGHRSTKSLGILASNDNLLATSSQGSDLHEGYPSRNLSSQLLELGKSPVLRKMLILPDFEAKYKLSSAFKVRPRLPQISPVKASPQKSFRDAIDK